MKEERLNMFHMLDIVYEEDNFRNIINRKPKLDVCIEFSTKDNNDIFYGIWTQNTFDAKMAYFSGIPCFLCDQWPTNGTIGQSFGTRQILFILNSFQFVELYTIWSLNNDETDYTVWWWWNRFLLSYTSAVSSYLLHYRFPY